MSSKPTAARRELDRLFRLGSAGSMTDTQLLDVFTGEDDESASLAFEALVERHGPMVMRTCRTLLRDLHAAEDAFQATFLVLARRAHTLASRDLLASWLYGVATRIARKARTLALRQRARERESAFRREVQNDETPPGALGGEVYNILHEEIDRLPRAYRSAVVVCYLDGKSQVQAAAQLHLTETTIRGRLARARKLLGRRLTQRGIAPASLLIALESLNACTFATGRAPARATASAALCFINRTTEAPGTASVVARALAEGEHSAMMFHHLKTFAAAVLALGAFATAGAFVPEQRAVAHPQKEASQPVETVTVDAELAKLVEARTVRASPRLQRQHDSLVHAALGSRRCR